MMNDEELHDLIKLKRYEQPEEGYFESFLEEFHDRQRSELLTGSARGLVLERVGAWFGQFGAMRWVAGAGLAYGAVALVLMVSGGAGVESGAGAIQSDISQAANDTADAEVVPVSMVFAEPMDFSPAQSQPVGDAGEHLF